MFTFRFVHRSFRAFDMIKFVQIEKTTENTILDCRRSENLFGKRDKSVYVRIIILFYFRQIVFKPEYMIETFDTIQTVNFIRIEGRPTLLNLNTFCTFGIEPTVKRLSYNSKKRIAIKSK